VNDLRDAKIFQMKNDKNTPGLQQMYNSPLTWGGLHILWNPPHVRKLLYICCKPGVRESVLIPNSNRELCRSTLTKRQKPMSTNTRLFQYKL